MIVWLASYPRSGNSLTRMLCRTLYGVQCHSVYREKLAYASEADLRSMQNSDERFLVKTHELPSDDNPAIYVLRDGRDALVSYAWFTISSGADSSDAGSQRKFNAALKRLIDGKSRAKYGDWGRHVTEWTTRVPPVAVLKFEDLMGSDRADLVRTALESVGFACSPQESAAVPSFERQHARNPRLFRRGQVGAWKDEMPPALVARFAKRYGDVMTQMGYELS